jgi:hypothetical protein
MLISRLEMLWINSFEKHEVPIQDMNTLLDIQNGERHRDHMHERPT